MKAQLDSLMVQFQTMRQLQPNGLIPPPSEELKGPGAMDVAAVVGVTPKQSVRDPKAPFGLKALKERNGPYTASPSKPGQTDTKLLPETMD